MEAEDWRTKAEPGTQKTEVELVSVRDKVKPGRMEDPGEVEGVKCPVTAKGLKVLGVLWTSTDQRGAGGTRDPGGPCWSWRER